MFARSVNSTPGPSKGTVDLMGDDVTWIKEWYTPTLGGEQGDRQNYKVKGWLKAKTDYRNSPATKLTQDVLELEKWKYYQEVPIVEHKETEEEVKEENGIDKSELESALAIKKDEGQVSGLGGMDS